MITVASGHNHTGAMVENTDGSNSLYTWGRGDWGQLGTGHMRSYTTPKEVQGFNVAPPRPESEILMYKQNLDSAEESENDDSDSESEF